METAQLLRATATLLDCPCVEEVFPWALIPEHQLASGISLASAHVPGFCTPTVQCHEEFGSS